jgi:hypothetical protein
VAFSLTELETDRNGKTTAVNLKNEVMLSGVLDKKLSLVSGFLLLNSIGGASSDETTAIAPATTLVTVEILACHLSIESGYLRQSNRHHTKVAQRHRGSPR